MWLLCIINFQVALPLSFNTVQGGSRNISAIHIGIQVAEWYPLSVYYKHTSMAPVA